MHTLVIDIGGTNVKVWKTGETDRIKIPTNKRFRPSALVEKVKEAAEGWTFDRISIGYPGEVLHGRPVADPVNLGSGWVNFDFAGAFGVSVRIQNDACMQALGSYEGGRMLYLGLGTGLGSAFISEGFVIPLALGDLIFAKGKRLDDHLNREGRRRSGRARWEAMIFRTTKMLQAAFLADYITLGGGNAEKLNKLPEHCRRGSNHNAYFGGLRLWEDAVQIVNAASVAFESETTTK